jgi:TRAP-type mannitol/chloroaromatic compound transport system permease large subunit
MSLCAVVGKNSTLIQVPFLNLMGNLIKRSGVVKIRVGGNTQENAVLVDTLDNGKVLEKQLIGGSVGLGLSLPIGC